MKTVVMRGRGTLVIPAALRARYGLEEGVAVELDEGPDGLLLRPVKRAELFDGAQFMEQLIRDFAALRADPVASAEYDAETSAWQNINDGLEDEPPYPLG